MKIKKKRTRTTIRHLINEDVKFKINSEVRLTIAKATSDCASFDVWVGVTANTRPVRDCIYHSIQNFIFTGFYRAQSTDYETIHRASTFST